MNRRHFLAAGAALMSPGAVAAAPSKPFSRADYDRMMVIDAMGSIGDFDPGPPPQRLLDAIAASGLTATSVTLGQGLTGDRFGKVVRKIAAYNEKISKVPDRLMRVRSAADLKTAKATGRMGVIFNTQDTGLLEGDIRRVGELADLGMRVIGMTYNLGNLVGDGSLEQANGGLTNFGREVVEEFGRQRIVMDLSHGGQRTIAEALALAQRPPCITHTGCRALTDYPRNVWDAELKACADKGGVVGIYFMPFLVKDRPPTREDLIAHIEHAVNVCGEDHVGLGTDGGIDAAVVTDRVREGQRRKFEERKAQGIAAPGESPDAFDFIEDYNSPDRFFRLAQDLSKRGWSTRKLEKLLGANFERAFGEVWG